MQFKSFLKRIQNQIKFYFQPVPEELIRNSNYLRLSIFVGYKLISFNFQLIKIWNRISNYKR